MSATLAATLAKPPPGTSYGLALSSVPGKCPRSRMMVCSVSPPSPSPGGAYQSDRSSGKAQLKDLGVKTVYDLRSDTEIERYETPCPEIEGVEIVRIPVFKVEDYSPQMMAKYA